MRVPQLPIYYFKPPRNSYDYRMRLSSFEKRYLFVGLIFISFLVGVIFFLRSLRPHSALSPEGTKVKGPINAPVWIQEFSDFQCPACRKANEILQEILNKYPGKIRLIYYHFPLRMHPWANLAHQCAQCAEMQGKFWAYHDLLYAKQPDWSGQQNPKETLVQYAISLGMNEAQFRKCADENQGNDQISNDIQRGQLQQVSSTPTFFVNGVRILGGNLFKEQMEKTIQAEMRKKS